MDKDFIMYIKEIELNEPSSSKQIEYVEKVLSVQFPNDYKQFVLAYDGGEGCVGSNSYLVLWTLNDIIELNEAYAVNQFAPGLILFGTDGADTAYAYDMRTDKKMIVEVPFIGMNLGNLTVCANNLNDFLGYLYNK